MVRKVKRRLLLLLFVMSYCIGCVVNPTYANYDDDFSDLPEHRENSGITEAKPDKILISDFTDVKENDWFYKNLQFLVDNGLINGKTSSSFEPNGHFSYAECSAVIVRYLGLGDEAAKRQARLTQEHPEMKSIWYAGYLEVLGNLGLFLDYGVFELDDGKIIAIDSQAANSPIERYRFAESISKSFETTGSIKAKNVFSEYGGHGREFIVGGNYKQEVLLQYQGRILDFDHIPDASREDVLKAYYNGIFSGDISGNFYPLSNLTRAEMAKVLSCICDFGLRERLISNGYGNEVTERMIHTDGSGVKTLDYDVWTELLKNESKSISLYEGSLEYTPSGDAPLGYAIDAYFYTPLGEEYVLSGEYSLKSRSKDALMLDGNDFKILLVLRNVTEGSRPEGVYSVIASNGSIIKEEPNIRQM